MKISQISNASLALSILLVVSSWTFANDYQFKTISIGSSQTYQYEQNKYHDLSGVAYGNGILLFGFDGGKNSQNPNIRFMKNGVEKPGVTLSRQVMQKDLEAMTFHRGEFYALSSLSQIDEDSESYRILASLKIDANGEILGERYMNLRPKVMDALSNFSKDEEWFNRIAISFGKTGGLNVEGMSTYRNNSILVGLRSPLYGNKFGSPITDKRFSLHKGLALILESNAIFDEGDKFKVHTLNLNGEGIRAMEYLNDIDKTLIVSGPVPKGNTYHLWLWGKNGFLEKLDVKQFKGLCRPESIFPDPNGGQVTVLSEQSGKACEGIKYNFIKLKYNGEK